MNNEIVNIYLYSQAEAIKYGTYVLIRPRNCGVEMVTVMINDLTYLN